MKHKLGLYAIYDKCTGSFIKTKIMHSNDAYKSNKDSLSVINELLTENPSLIYNYPENEIPKKSETWDEDDCFKASDEHIECEICYDFFLKKDMAFIPTQEELDENPGSLRVCKKCRI